LAGAPTHEPQEDQSDGNDSHVFSSFGAQVGAPQTSFTAALKTLVCATWEHANGKRRGVSVPNFAAGGRNARRRAHHSHTQASAEDQPSVERGPHTIVGTGSTQALSGVVTTKQIVGSLN
jgi:hypothetical protein